ncbi:MAG: pseudaminic acid synthase [Bacteroidota bacterium]
MKFEIENSSVGESSHTFIIAELSANHNHSFETALKSIEAIKECGADAVKLQTYTADTITIDCDKEHFQIKQGTLWDGTTLYKLYQQAYTPWEWQPKLKNYAESIGLICFSTPFDKTAVDFLETMNVPAYKIASFEIVDLPLIEYAASKRKPIIISTGIATEDEITEAVDACRKNGNEQIALLKCTSEYPAPIEEANLLSIPYLKEKFNVVAGLSDHTLGITTSIAAVALGANIIEKHFILDRTIGGPDSYFSLEPNEFKQMVTAIRDAEKSLGKPTFELTEKIKKSRHFSRSLFAVKNILQGEMLTEDNVRSIRPSGGLPPKEIYKVLGKKAAHNIFKGTPINWNLIE